MDSILHTATLEVNYDVSAAHDREPDNIRFRPIGVAGGPWGPWPPNIIPGCDYVPSSDSLNLGLRWRATKRIRPTQLSVVFM